MHSLSAGADGGTALSFTAGAGSTALTERLEDWKRTANQASILPPVDVLWRKFAPTNQANLSFNLISIL